jgi:hypothetical protein
MQSFSVKGVTDPDGDKVTITIDSVTQDEPVSGPGYYCPDAAIDGSTVDLRIERFDKSQTAYGKGKGNGRVYFVNFTASDGHGGSCSGTAQLCVPRESSKKAQCVDDGVRHNSTDASQCHPF